MIGLCNCPITGVRLQPTVQLQLCRLINAKYSSLYAPTTLEEIVMVMKLKLDSEITQLAIIGYLKSDSDISQSY